jgi:hypothetical protein
MAIFYIDICKQMFPEIKFKANRTLEGLDQIFNLNIAMLELFACKFTFDAHHPKIFDEDLKQLISERLKNPKTGMNGCLMGWLKKNLEHIPLFKKHFPTEVVAKLRVRRFSGLFWPLFDSNCGGHI